MTWKVADREWGNHCFEGTFSLRLNSKSLYSVPRKQGSGAERPAVGAVRAEFQSALAAGRPRFLL